MFITYSKPSKKPSHPKNPNGQKNINKFFLKLFYCTVWTSLSINHRLQYLFYFKYKNHNKLPTEFNI
jgi:hypothetical protein